MPPGPRQRRALRDAVPPVGSTRMLGNLFGGGGGSGPEPKVATKVFFDIEIGGVPSGHLFDPFFCQIPARLIPSCPPHQRRAGCRPL